MGPLSNLQDRNDSSIIKDSVDVLSFQEGMKFDHNLEENIENSSKDGESLQRTKRRDIIRNAQEQLFNPDLLRNKYQGFIVNEKS